LNKVEELKQRREESLEIIFNSDEWKKLSSFLSIPQAAEFLNLSRITILREIRDGKLNAITRKARERKSYLILKSALAEYIKRSVV